MASHSPVAPSAEVLRHFSPLDEAPLHRLEEIAREAEWRQAGRKEVLMELGDTDEHSLFLIKGNILLEAADGRKRIIKHTDPAANSPLSRLRPSRYRVTALTPVQYVRIDNAVLDRLLQEEDTSELASSHYYVVEEGGNGSETADFASQALAQIYEDLHHDRLLLLSWHPVALGVTRGLLDDEREHDERTALAMLDPVLALKLLRKARAPGGALDERLDEAMKRLPEERIQRLAFFNLFRESCRPSSRLMQEVFRDTWEQSIAVSRLAAEMAREQGLAPVESAALAGLLHGVGKLTLLSYAYNFYREVTLEELKICTQMFSKETGRMVLNHWNLPQSLVRGINDSFEWSQDHGGSAPTLSDILIAARLYTRLARKHKALRKVPALRKLELTDPSSSRGQALQNLVIQAVAEARETLGLIRRKPAARAPEPTT